MNTTNQIQSLTPQVQPHGFILKATFRKSFGIRIVYFGSVPVDRIRAEYRKPDVDFEALPFKTQKEASEFPFPTADAAANMVSYAFYNKVEMKDVDFEVVEAQK